MYYIAGPLFNPENIRILKEIESLLNEKGIEYFSPREYGTIVGEKMTPERMKRIFDMNILMLNKCDNLIAIIDDRDIGTIFEMGFFYSKYDDIIGLIPNIITFSSQDHGVNVMLRHAVKFHTNGLEELSAAINGFGHNELETIS